MVESTLVEMEYALIEQAQQGNRHAFSDLVHLHRADVVAVVFRMCGDLLLAEDASQEAFIRAWHKLPTYQPTGSFRNWLFRIATNIAVDMLRREKTTVDIDNLPLSNPGHGPEEAVSGHERAELVQRAIMELPVSSRAALILREYQGLSYKEISETLDIPLGTVMSRLNYARKRLLEILEPSREAIL